MRAAAVADRLILAVDDDEHTRNLLRDLCSALGFRVVVAEDGQAALDRMAEARPDLVLLDLMMPLKDGFTVLQEMRASSVLARVPVIILTAMGDMSGKIRGMELGADDYVTKPFKLADLQTRIQSALMVRDYRERLTAPEDALSDLRPIDPLTGAGTYAQLKASLDSEVARAKRYGRPVSALLFGFDDYTSLRHQVGRESCERLVVDLSRAVRTIFRGADRLFRTDVDEFVLLLPETDLPSARAAAERLHRSVQGLRADGRDGPASVRLRIAGAVYPREGIHSSEDLLREANRVYKSLRDSASNRFVFEA